jgi:SAM-dependent methyltransferase
MKRHILGVARAAGMLRSGDLVLRMCRKLAAYNRNRAFVLAHAEFATPPDDLMFDVCNHVDYELYREVGRRHAEVFARVIRERGFQPPISILEWGCGPGRVIRHMRDCFRAHEATLTGTDVNARSIAWCAENIPNVDFAVNGFMPPLPFADDTFDAGYSYSVFTHLAEPAQRAWARELLRVLKPGGLLICTTLGDHYRERLAHRGETARYRQGQMVIQDGYEEGKKWFLALHPPSYVREKLLVEFTDVRAMEVPLESLLEQDLWSASKPA